LAAVGVFLAALIGNLAFHPVPLYGTETDLLGEYIPAARDLGRLAINPAHFTTKGPGYPLLLALTVPLTQGDMFLAARVIGALATALTVWITFLLFAKLLDSQTALAVSLGLLVNPTFVGAAVEAGTDLPTLGMALGSLYLTIGSATTRRLLLGGALAGCAVLSRSNYLFLPIAGCLTLLSRLESRRRAAYYGLGFGVPVLSWLAMCYFAPGGIPRDTNYLNLAYAVYGSRQTWEDFLTDTAPQFHSYVDVLTLRPALALGTLAVSMATRWFKDASQLLNLPLGMLGVVGIVWCWRKQSSARVLWTHGLLAYGVLCLVFYAPRFSLFLLPFYLSGACLLLLRTAQPLDGEWGRGQRNRLWRAAGFGLLAVLYVVSAVTALRQVRSTLAQTPYVTRELGLALRRLDPAEGRLMARKPHVAFYADKQHVPLPRLRSITDLIQVANGQRVRYVSVSTGEALLRPEYAVLTDSGVVLPGLRQVVYRRDRRGRSGAVYIVEAPLRTDAKQRRAVAESLGAGGGAVSWARHVAAATELLYAGEYQRVLAHLAVAEKLGPPDADVAALESNAYHALGAYEDAALACVRSMALGGATAAHFDQLGRIRFKQGRFAEASQNFRKALAIDPSAPEREYLLGLSEWSGGRFAAAAQGFARYLQAVPGDIEARKLVVLSLARSGDVAGAMRTIEEGRRRGEIGRAELTTLADSLRSAAR
jgi:cytochrome c-type biogenesis protein CcmH/NrfG